MANSINQEQILNDLRNAMQTNPVGARRTGLIDDLLKYLTVASEGQLGGLTARQLAQATGGKHQSTWVGRLLRDMEQDGAVYHEISPDDQKTFLWYIVCSEAS